MDGGSMTTTTHRQDLIWDYHPFTPDELKDVPHLCVANTTRHQPIGEGHLCVPTEHATLLVPVFLTPQIPATILSPDEIALANGCSGYVTVSEFVGKHCCLQLHRTLTNGKDVTILLVHHQGLLYSKPLIAPDHTHQTWMTDSPKICCSHTDTVSVSALTAEQSRYLWNFWTGHINHGTLLHLHNHVDGIPLIKPGTMFNACPICMHAKLHHADRQPE